MVVRAGICDAEAQDDLIDERGIGQLKAARGEIGSRLEHQFVAPRFERIAFEQGRIAATVAVRRRADKSRALVSFQTKQLDRNARTGLSLGGIEYVGGQFSHCQASLSVLPSRVRSAPWMRRAVIV